MRRKQQLIQSMNANDWHPSSLKFLFKLTWIQKNATSTWGAGSLVSPVLVLSERSVLFLPQQELSSL